MRDIEIARTSLFPLGKPQERVLNFIPMLARHGEPLLAQMRARATRARGARSHRDSPATHRDERVAAGRARERGPRAPRALGPRGDARRHRHSAQPHRGTRATALSRALSRA